jgi:quinoprotein glucose dehydrogenase
VAPRITAEQEIGMLHKISFVIFLVAFGTAVATQKSQEWPVYGGDPGGTKYSPLTQINRETVAKLAVAWTWKTGEKPIPDKGVVPSKFEATPLMIDDVLYLSTPYNRVVALDANDGQELWSYDPHSYDMGPGPISVQFGYHRGVASWSDGTRRRIFINTRTRLVALDAKTGQPIPSFGREGEIDLTKDLVWEVKRKNYYMQTSPPIVYKDIIVVGSAISDSVGEVQSPPGDLQAFDVRTGKRVWIFHTVPPPGEFGNETWERDSWSVTGHANVWVPMALDEPRGLLYVPVSTPANDYYGGQRKGNNLFADSIVCLNAKTGKRVWHFQTVHHGLWDRDGVMMPALGTVRVDGKAIDIVAAPSKQGFMYVFDRVTGKPVWPIEERPVPQTDVPGEQTSPTQPFPTKPPAFAKQGFSEDDVIDFTPELRAKALERLKGLRFGSLFIPPSMEGTVLMPGNGGGANWGGGAFDPETGIIYVRSHNQPKLITLEKANPAAVTGRTEDFNYGNRVVKLEKQASGLPVSGTYPGVLEGEIWYHFPTDLTISGLPLNKPPYGQLTAIDLNKGEIAWQIVAGDTPSIRNHALLKDLHLPPVGAGGASSPMVTRGGLLFYCDGGTRTLIAANKQNGETLWTGALGASADATPMTYQTKAGRQIVVVAAGGGANAALMAFALPAATPSSEPPR